MRFLNKNKVLFLIIISVLTVSFFANRLKIRTVVFELQKPKLPEAVDFYGNGVEDSDAIVGDDYMKSEEDSKESEEKINPPEIKDYKQSHYDNQIPDSYNLAVPFAPQAPRGDWSLPYQEACEEASLIMAYRFFSKQGLTYDEMDSEIKKLVAWQIEKFGYYKDTTSKEVVIMARDYFGMDSELDFDTSVDNIKKIISNNNLIIIPAAGRLLPNPYFSGEGPAYHMLLIRGYTKTHFITNDPGTKRGEEFVYKHNDLIRAIHDLPFDSGGDNIDNLEDKIKEGQKVLIVIKGMM
jgi:hypothetical protein